MMPEASPSKRRLGHALLLSFFLSFLLFFPLCCEYQNITMVDLKKQILKRLEKNVMNEKKTPPVYQTNHESCLLLKEPNRDCRRGDLISSCWEKFAGMHSVDRGSIDHCDADVSHSSRITPLKLKRGKSTCRKMLSKKKKKKEKDRIS